MTITIASRPIFLFPLGGELLQSLMLMSANHYDSVCRSFSQEGGRLHTQAKREAILTELNETPHEIRLSTEELDLLMKVCENTAALATDKRQDVYEFARLCHRAFDLGTERSASPHNLYVSG